MQVSHTIVYSDQTGRIIADVTVFFGGKADFVNLAIGKIFSGMTTRASSFCAVENGFAALGR